MNLELQEFCTIRNFDFALLGILNFWNFADRVILYRFETEASACHKKTSTEKCEWGGPQTDTQLPQIPFSRQLLSRKDFFILLLSSICCVFCASCTGLVTFLATQSSATQVDSLATLPPMPTMGVMVAMEVLLHVSFYIYANLEELYV
jgi:hypothetical protein